MLAGAAIVDVLERLAFTARQEGRRWLRTAARVGLTNSLTSVDRSEKHLSAPPWGVVFAWSGYWTSCGGQTALSPLHWAVLQFTESNFQRSAWLPLFQVVCFSMRMLTESSLDSEIARPESANVEPARRPNVLRRMYHWVLGWAETRYGTPALATISFAESSFFPIPPDVLQIALSISRPRRSFFYALVSAVASILGGVLGWYIGYAFWSVTGEFFYAYVPGFTREKFEFVSGLYMQGAFLAILCAAFTPIPYKIFTIAAGVCQIPLPVLIVASGIGRTARFMLVATVIFFFGPLAKDLLEKYFEWITLALFAMLVGGFFVLHQLSH